MSKIREQFAAPPDSSLADEPASDLLPYVIFTQLKKDGPFIYAGWLEAADDDMAIAFAREHYGQDQECVNVMAIRREHVTSSDGLYGEGNEASKHQGNKSESAKPSPQPSPKERGGTTFQVFTQKKAGDLWISAGSIEAEHPSAAIDAAKASIKQARDAHVVWVANERNVLATHGDLVWRYTDQSYRLARGYGRTVRAKWTQFRDETQLAEYERDDLREAF